MSPGKDQHLPTRLLHRLCHLLELRTGGWEIIQLNVVAIIRQPQRNTQPDATGGAGDTLYTDAHDSLGGRV
jgi:hypothetical protein